MSRPNLALHGGTPVRGSVLPYGRQLVDQRDIEAVVEVLESGWLTTGPKVAEFEEQIAATAGVSHAVAVNNGTSALHAMLHALGIGSGDEVLVPSMTFAATANAALYTGGRPVFCDVCPDTLLLNAEDAARHVTDRTRAIIPVDYAGQPADYDELAVLAREYDLHLVADACHSIGGAYAGRAVGSLAEMTAFSFHPVKHVTCGEGGCVTTDDVELATRMRSFRNHGITTDHLQRSQRGTWHYEMTELGHNYRLTDIQCALGISQLRHLTDWVDRRREIAATYIDALHQIPGVEPLQLRPGREHAYHLFVVSLDFDILDGDRDAFFAAMRAEGIGVNVHYVPVHLHPYYRERLGTEPGDCPVTLEAYQRILTIPLFPSMGDGDVQDVIDALAKVAAYYLRPTI